MKRFTRIPLELDEANAFVEAHHRHHGPVRGFKFALGAVEAGKILGWRSSDARPRAKCRTA